MSNSMTPFARYRAGYNDGYECKKIRMPDDIDYMRGYREGKDDDSVGMPDKFEPNKDEETMWKTWGDQ